MKHAIVFLALAGTGTAGWALAGAAGQDAGAPAPAVVVEEHPAPGARDVVFTGHVTENGRGAPLAGAQVLLPALNRGALTDGAGRYTLAVPRTALGERVRIEARLIGYQTAARTVRVTGDTVRADFRLAPAVVALEEIAVTSAPAAVKARALAGSTVYLQVADAATVHAGRASVGVPRGVVPPGMRHPADPDSFNTESYDRIFENPFLAAATNPLSTFSIDVDRASYSNVRRFINEGRRPPVDAVRIEELINYFTYDYPEPEGEAPVSITTELGRAPWTPEHYLLRIGLQAPRIETKDLPPSNLVFLIDVSGSMEAPNKLPLLKQAFGLLVNELREQDRVAIVVYAGAAGLVLESTPGDRKDVIMEAISRLEAGGSTAGGAGLRLAYDVAQRNHIPGGNNRVILATDGDFNVGPSSDAEMIRLIEEKRAQGTFLTVLGFGTGNLKDSKMEKLADHGNGNYAYIDDLMEARKVLVSEVGGTLLTVAKDVKLQIEFNPECVQAYRLIGYENRLLAAEDFNDDTKDAGELGAGHSVTALYEIVPVGVESAAKIRGVDPLRYQTGRAGTPAAQSDELAFVKLRYKAPEGERSELIEHVVRDEVVASPSADFRFAAAVAAFGMVLRESEHRGSATIEQVIALAREGLGEDREGYRAEFIRLAEKVKATEMLAAGR
jgi:Ca-activated chloride channel family protein